MYKCGSRYLCLLPCGSLPYGHQRFVPSIANIEKWTPIERSLRNLLRTLIVKSLIDNIFHRKTGLEFRRAHQALLCWQEGDHQLASFAQLVTGEAEKISLIVSYFKLEIFLSTQGHFMYTFQVSILSVLFQNDLRQDHIPQSSEY